MCQFFHDLVQRLQTPSAKHWETLISTQSFFSQSDLFHSCIFMRCIYFFFEGKKQRLVLNQLWVACVGFRKEKDLCLRAVSPAVEIGRERMLSHRCSECPVNPVFTPPFVLQGAAAPVTEEAIPFALVVCLGVSPSSQFTNSGSKLTLPDPTLMKKNARLTSNLNDSHI